MKNVFYFTLKALFVLKILKFLSWLFGHKINGLIRKMRLISKPITSQPGYLTIVIRMLPNISRNERNETAKFGELINYSMRNIFLEKLSTKCPGETIPDPFLKTQNWTYLWIDNLKFCTICFYCLPKWELSNYIETKLLTTYFYLI